MNKQALDTTSTWAQLRGHPLLGSALPAAGLGYGAYALSKKQKEKGKKTNPLLNAAIASSILPIIQGVQGYGIGPALNRWGLKGIGASKAETLGRSEMKNRPRYTNAWMLGAASGLKSDLKASPATQYLMDTIDKFPDNWREELGNNQLPRLSLRDQVIPRVYKDHNALESYLKSMEKPASITYNVPVTLTKREVLADPALTFYEKADIHRIMDQASFGDGGFINTKDITRGVVGAGLGAAGAGLFGKVFGSVFGGLSPKSQRIVQGTGALAGLLRNTGIWTN